jgi:integrase
MIALLGGEGGLRVGEIVALEWSDIDLEQSRLFHRLPIWRVFANSFHFLCLSLAGRCRSFRPFAS